MAASDPHHELICAPYVVYGDTYIDPVNLALVSGHGNGYDDCVAEVTHTVT